MKVGNLAGLSALGLMLFLSLIEFINAGYWILTTQWFLEPTPKAALWFTNNELAVLSMGGGIACAALSVMIGLDLNRKARIKMAKPESTQPA